MDGVWIEEDLLYPLIRGRDVGRYCAKTEGWHQIIPNAHYEKVESEEDFADHFPLTYSYFKNYEEILTNRSSYKRYQLHLPFYSIYCIGEYSFSPFKVVWMEQQNPSMFRAAVVSNDSSDIIPNTLIIPDHKIYFASFTSEEEAHYVCGFLNSQPVKTWLGGFLLGKQIGTTVFEHMNVPLYDAKKNECVEIANTSMTAHQKRANSSIVASLDHQTELKLSRNVQTLCSAVSSKSG